MAVPRNAKHEKKSSGINDSVVATAAIADDAVTAAKMSIFVSNEITGNGSAQSTAHGLGVAPSVVLVSITEAAETLTLDIAEGTHTSTNVIVTATNGMKYKFIAIA